MSSEQAPQGIAFWLQEARDLMMAAEQCWRADEAFLHKGEQAKVQLFGSKLVQQYLDAEVELNWLYNILAGLAIYYLAIGILVHRNGGDSLEQQGPKLLELLAACGVAPSPVQEKFLRRVEQALWLADQQGPWNIKLQPEQLKTLQQTIGAEDRINEADKRAIDALFARLIAAALQELASGIES